MAVVSGEQFGAVPFGMVQEVVSARVFLKVAVKDVESTSVDRDSE